MCPLATMVAKDVDALQQAASKVDHALAPGYEWSTSPQLLCFPVLLMVTLPREYSTQIYWQSLFLWHHASPPFDLFIRALPPPLLNCLHQFIHLPNLLVAHLVQKRRVELLFFPPIPF